MNEPEGETYNTKSVVVFFRDSGRESRPSESGAERVARGAFTLSQPRGAQKVRISDKVYSWLARSECKPVATQKTQRSWQGRCAMTQQITNDGED